MIKYQSNIFIVILLCIIWSACQRIADPCLQPTLISVSVGTYKPADTGTSGVDSVLPKAVFGYVDNGMRQYSGSKANKFLMRLSSQKDTCKWFISPDSTATGLDTITMIYNRQLNFISTSCGYAYHYSLYDVKWTTNNIDSIKIKSVIVEGAANTENVEIFY